jgi:hypothetical protein
VDLERIAEDRKQFTRSLYLEKVTAAAAIPLFYSEFYLLSPVF